MINIYLVIEKQPDSDIRLFYFLKKCVSRNYDFTQN